MKTYPTFLKFNLALVLATISLSLFAQHKDNYQLSGTVTHHQKPAEGVTLFIKELQRTTLTNENGRFNFDNLKPGAYHIIVKSPGADAQERMVELTHSVKNLDFNFSGSARTLKEVKVVAQHNMNEQPVSVGKTKIKAFDLPQSITIINNELIADQQVNKLSDIIQNVNGVALGTTRGSTSESFYSRGYSLGKNSILKNGTSVNAAVIPEASTLESVEVLKGSAALLYGNVGTGAVINMVTKKPKFDFGGEVSLRAGSYAMYKPIIDFYGPISKDLAYRVVGSYENSGSFRNNVNSDKIYINPSLIYKAGEQTTVLLQADYLKNDFNPDFGIGTLDGKIPTQINRNSFFNTPWAFNRINQTTTSLTIDHQLKDSWSVNFIGAYQNYARDYFSTERIQAAANGDWLRALNRSKTKENDFSEQINISGKLNTGKISHQILLGTDADQYQSISDKFNSFATYDTINILDPNKYTPRTDMPRAEELSRTTSPTYRFGVYTQDMIGLSDQFKVLAGIRWSYQKVNDAKVKDLINGNVITDESTSKNDQAFSPKFALIYQPFETTSLYASYANSFEVNKGTDVYFNNLKPSIIDQYEVGVKNELLKGRLSANLALYKIINNNLAQQAEFKADGTENLDSNVKEFTGQTTSDGFEVDLNGKIVDDLNFIAGYSYTFMRYTKTSGLNGSYMEGEQLVRNVPHTANATLFYTCNHSSFIKGLKLGASVFYTGNRYAGWNNKIGQSQTKSRIIPVHAYTTFDFSAGYHFRKFSVLAKVSNLTDALSYNVHENYSVNPIAPRQFSTTISYKF